MNATIRANRANFIRILPLWDKEFRVVDFTLAAEHEFGAVVVLLADVFVRILVGLPAHHESRGRPRSCVSAGIIDRRLILQRIHIHACETLGHDQLGCVRRSTRIQPEFLVHTGCLDHEGVTLPVADRIAVVGRDEILRMLRAVQIDDPVRVRSAHIQDIDTFQILLLVDELGAVRRGELSGNPRSLTARMRLELVNLALVVDSARPRLERNLIHDIGGQRGNGATAPAAWLLTRDRTDPRLVIGSSRSWRGWCRWSASAASTTAFVAIVALALVSTLLFLRSGVLVVTS